ncbi:hypothetical protein [Massilia timonae]|uniref:hypothetical protein n=1 Tax=Massilia timonae TaxID=47229 RepID=UPI0028D53DC9|nr:hypothetical protein [Massilia timonae]
MGHLMQLGIAMFEFAEKERADQAEIWAKTNLPNISDFQKAFPDAKLVHGVLGGSARPPV